MALTITFEEIKDYYDTIGKDGERLWTKENVRLAVEKGKITEEEYRMITGEDYVK